MSAEVEPSAKIDDRGYDEYDNRYDDGSDDGSDDDVEYVNKAVNVDSEKKAPFEGEKIALMMEYGNLGMADALLWKTLEQADHFSLDLIIRLMNGGFHKHATCLFEKTLDKAFQFDPDDIIRLFKFFLKRRASFCLRRQ